MILAYIVVSRIIGILVYIVLRGSIVAAYTFNFFLFFLTFFFFFFFIGLLGILIFITLVARVLLVEVEVLDYNSISK